MPLASSREPRLNRIKALVVPQNLLMDLIQMNLGGSLGHRRYGASVPILEGCKVVAVHHEPWNRSFMVLVSHESFDEVPPGERIPEMRYDQMFRTEDTDHHTVVSVD